MVISMNSLKPTSCRMPTHKCDFLVIGSGIAGLTFALKVAEFGTVAIITKKEIMEANTAYAQGGIAGVLEHGKDSFKKHIEDTITAGDGFCDPQVVEMVVEKGPSLIRDLINFGVQFTRKNGKLDLGREGGHSVNRIIHAADATGLEIEKVLVGQVQNHPNIQVFEHHFAMELMTSHHPDAEVGNKKPNCYGAYVLDEKTDSVYRFLSKITVLASGGAGEVYLHTTNPAVATGDGIAMAFRAKARIRHMEFVQFHPTTLHVPEANSFLISEAVRGAGGILRNSSGIAFMAEYDERMELAPRDIVARAIDHQLKKRGDSCVYLDVTHLDAELVKKSFPTIYEKCLLYGIDITKNQIPVVPAMHYICGGIETDLYGQTSINRLFACGETACTGLHGANRLASNSLLESLVFADQAAKKALTQFEEFELNQSVSVWNEGEATISADEVLISRKRQELKQIMWNYVGIVRSNSGLEHAMRGIELMNEESEHLARQSKVSVPLCEFRNLATVGFLIVKAAMERKESRGLHFNTDFPNKYESEMKSAG